MAKTSEPKDSTHRAGWVFGSFLLAVLVAVLFIGPDALPKFKLVILTFLIAVCGGFLGALMSGRFVSDFSAHTGQAGGTDQSPKGRPYAKLTARAVGGLGVFLFTFVLAAWLFGLFERPGGILPEQTPASTTQPSHAMMPSEPLLFSVVVNRISGQESRASANFSVPHVSATRLKWEVDLPPPSREVIRFGVNLDKSFALDVNLLDNLRDGDITANAFRSQRYSLYIARVRFVGPEATSIDAASFWTKHPHGFRINAYAVD